MKHLKPLLIVALFGFCMCMVAGCNTVEGAGKDVEAAGEGIADVAGGDKKDDS